MNDGKNSLPAMVAGLTSWGEHVNKESFSINPFSLNKEPAPIRSPGGNETQSKVSVCVCVRVGGRGFLYSCHWIDNGTNHLRSCSWHTIWNLGHLHSASVGARQPSARLDAYMFILHLLYGRQTAIYIHVLFCWGCSPTWLLTYILAQSRGGPLPWHWV